MRATERSLPSFDLARVDDGKSLVVHLRRKLLVELVEVRARLGNIVWTEAEPPITLHIIPVMLPERRHRQAAPLGQRRGYRLAAKVHSVTFRDLLLHSVTVP